MASLGALVSGGYGILHDQLTYTISPEYFTRFKFDQFRAMDFGFPERVFVGIIGFLATWWVGFFAGWFLARIAVPVWPARRAWLEVGRGFLLMTGIALLSGMVGYGLGFLPYGKSDPWLEIYASRGVNDIQAFVQVGYIHNAGYLGGFFGLVAAVLWVVPKRRHTVGAGFLRYGENPTADERDGRR